MAATGGQYGWDGTKEDREVLGRWVQRGKRAEAMEAICRARFFVSFVFPFALFSSLSPFFSLFLSSSSRCAKLPLCNLLSPPSSPPTSPPRPSKPASSSVSSGSAAPPPLRPTTRPTQLHQADSHLLGPSSTAREGRCLPSSMWVVARVVFCLRG